ncbi:hypothetical protein EDB86DRAFT_3212220 [Lactarius hatsudake]|nr:hypothetical protein EDB86DRAFT_3212220 [Lactarius hatsudake]
MAREPTTTEQPESDRHDRHCGPCTDSGITFPHSKNDNQIPTKRMAWEPTTDNDNDRRRDSRLITALPQRRGQLPTRPVRDQRQSQQTDTPNRYETTIRSHGTNRCQDTTRTDNGDYQRSTSRPTTQPTNAGRNRYAALNSDATCNDAHTTRMPDAWTLATHKRKRTTGKDTIPTPSRPDPSKGGTQSRLETAEVEAHAGVPARGDAQPPLIPSPDPGATPLTKRLDAQSDVFGVARARSPRLLQMLARVREARSNAETLQAGEDRPPTATTTILSSEQRRRPWTINEPTGAGARPSPSTRDTDVAPHEDEEESDDEGVTSLYQTTIVGETLDRHDTARKKSNRHASNLHVRSSRMQELRRRIREVMSTTTETWPQPEEIRRPSPPSEPDLDSTDDEQSSREESLRRTVDPVHAAE